MDYRTLQECRLLKKNGEAQRTVNGVSGGRPVSVECGAVIRQAKQIKACSEKRGNVEICDYGLRRRGEKFKA